MSDEELIEQGRRTASHYRGAFWEGPFSEALDRIEQLSAVADAAREITPKANPDYPWRKLYRALRQLDVPVDVPVDVPALDDDNE